MPAANNTNSVIIFEFREYILELFKHIDRTYKAQGYLCFYFLKKNKTKYLQQLKITKMSVKYKYCLEIQKIQLHTMMTTSKPHLSKVASYQIKIGIYPTLQLSKIVASMPKHILKGYTQISVKEQASLFRPKIPLRGNLIAEQKNEFDFSNKK